MIFSIERAKDILQTTPTTLRAMLAPLDEAWTHQPYGPGTWTAHEVVAHLIFAERTDWPPRWTHILEHGDSAPFPPFDRSGHFPLARAHTTRELLDIFERERQANLKALDELRLTPSQLAGPGMHPALGSVTLGNLIATWAAHDLNHISQISKALAFQLKESVGPWEKFLSIMGPPNPR
jgi:hypothetical protein